MVEALCLVVWFVGVAVCVTGGHGEIPTYIGGFLQGLGIGVFLALRLTEAFHAASRK